MGFAEPLKFLTDFADQAVVLPLVLAVALVLVCQGWRRGAGAWLVSIGATFSVMLALKLIFLGCTPVFGAVDLHSPSGHAAAATVLCGGLGAIYRGRHKVVLACAILAGIVIGLTRIGLHEHSGPEVLLGGAIGLAGAMGIKLVHSREQLEEFDRILGDERTFHLLEQFIPGDVFHVDSIVRDRAVILAVASAYGRPPMEVAHGGGIFTTRIVEHGSETGNALLEMNARVLPALGLQRGVSHTEFIRAADGQLYFLETSARVGGAHISDLVEAATGVNMWVEWAKVESDPNYQAPVPRTDYAGLIVSLARQEWPDSSAWTEPEIVWRMQKAHHIGVIVVSPRNDRISELLESLTARVRDDFHASAPPRDRPTW